MLNYLIEDIQLDLCRKPDVLQFFKYLFFKRSFQTVFLYRVRNSIQHKRVINKLNIILDWFAFFLTSCDISAKASIGRAFYLPHPTGIVIGGGCIIGDNVTIYQNVTLGRRDDKIPHYPRIDDNVILFCGSVVLGNVLVGKSTKVAANSVILVNTPENSVFAGIPGRDISKC